MKNLLGVTACDTVTLMVLVDCGNTSGVYSLDITGSTGNYIKKIKCYYIYMQGYRITATYIMRVHTIYNSYVVSIH